MLYTIDPKGVYRPIARLWPPDNGVFIAALMTDDGECNWIVPLNALMIVGSSAERDLALNSVESYKPDIREMQQRFLGRQC